MMWKQKLEVASWSYCFRGQRAKRKMAAGVGRGKGAGALADASFYWVQDLSPCDIATHFQSSHFNKHNTDSLYTYTQALT